jgi:hypothetical protein
MEWGGVEVDGRILGGLTRIDNMGKNGGLES